MTRLSELAERLLGVIIGSFLSGGKPSPPNHTLFLTPHPMKLYPAGYDVSAVSNAFGGGWGGGVCLSTTVHVDVEELQAFPGLQI